MEFDIREWTEEIWEYCQEHWAVCLAAAVVVLILLFSVGLVRSAKRDDLNGSEMQDTAETQGAAGETDSPMPAPEPALNPEPLPEAEPASQPEPPSEMDSQPDPEPERAAAAAQGVVERLLKDVEEASGAAGQKVESIELKIEKAQLTIRYAGASNDGDTAEPKTFTGEIGVREEAEAHHSIEDAAEEPAQTESETAVPKKFGSENMNITRSGRVYTEEELLNQIMD